VKAYSTDLRGRVLAACEGGMGTAEAAETFAVRESWVRRVKPRFREAGEVAPRRPARPGPPPALAGHDDRLREEVRGYPGRTAAECRDRLGLTVAVVTVWRALRRLDLTYKKARPAIVTGSEPAAGLRFGETQEGSPCPRRRSRPSRRSSAT
jgi:transposase